MKPSTSSGPLRCGPRHGGPFRGGPLRGGRPYLSPPKSAHGYRTVPIHPVLAERLDEWRAVQANQLFAKGLGPQYMFTNSELGPWFPSGISHHWRQDVKRALAEG